MTTLSSNLKEALRKNTRAYLVINVSTGLVFALLGLATMVIGLLVGSPDTRTWIVLGGIALLIFGAATAWYYWKTRVDVVELLERQPERVVWLYKKLSTGSVSGVTVARFSFLVFGLDNRRRIQVRLPTRDIDRFIEELCSLLGHVTSGYSPELERRYQNNPQDLRKAKG